MPSCFEKARPARLLLIVLLCAACSRPVQQNAISPNPSAGLQDMPANAVPSLGGTSWRLVKFEGGDGAVLAPDNREAYTINFGADGSVSTRIDCNRGRGTWNSSGPSQLRFGPLALTRAMCPPAPLNDRIAKDWEYVRSYTMKEGHLFFALMADAGIYEFEPGTGTGTGR